jgi:hypothetical protein
MIYPSGVDDAQADQRQREGEQERVTEYGPRQVTDVAKGAQGAEDKKNPPFKQHSAEHHNNVDGTVDGLG